MHSAKHSHQEAPIILIILKNAGLYVRDQFLKSTTNVELQKFNFKDEHYFNVIAKMGNLDSKDIILVGAHYDGFSDLPGADDNASGTAGLIELAHLLKNKKLNKQIHLIAYTTEEPPFFASKFIGSYIHAQSIKDDITHQIKDYGRRVLAITSLKLKN